MIETRELSFSYNSEPENQTPDAKVLDRISVDFTKGQWVCILGTNGSGKSTLARQLNGLLLPDSGSVTVDGLDTLNEDELWQIRRKVAFVFQNPDNQLVATTVEDDIAFGPENLGFSSDKISSLVEEALRVTGLSELRDKAPHLLSGGEKQRVAIAGALAMASDYLVLDEPTSMLDPKLRESVLGVLRFLHEEKGMGIIYITNIMEEALLADRVVILDKGRIVRQGTAREIFSDADYLRSLGLNVPPLCRISTALGEYGYERLAGKICEEELLEAMVSSYPPQLLKGKKSLISDVSLPVSSVTDNNGDDDFICLEKVSFVYQEKGISQVAALKEIDLSVKSGDFLAIIGPSGSGKSTLAMILSGLFSPCSGRVLLQGESQDNGMIFPEVAIIFQYPEQQLFAESIYEEVAFGLRNRGLAEELIKKRAYKALSDVGLDPQLYWHRSPFELSGGQKRRVCLATVLASNPQMIIFDEPTAGLDERGRAWIKDLACQLNQQGKTIVWISHTMEEVADLAQKVAVIVQGRCVALRPVDQIFNDAELLADNSLALPGAAHLLRELKRLGYPLPAQAITETGAIHELLEMLGGLQDVE